MANEVEVLQPSSLESYPWPEIDPHSVEQRTRSMVGRDIDLIRRCVEGSKVNMEALRENERKMGSTEEEVILALISHRRLQMNPVTGVRQEPRWLECIRYSLRKSAPIEIVYPQCCVIPNAPKRYTNLGSAAGEDCMIEFFKQINNQVKELYAPGLRFHILSDAGLYASAFQTHQTEVDAYYESVNDRIGKLGASDCVILHDYSELLRTECRSDYQRLYYSIGYRVWGDDPKKLLPDTGVRTLRRSVRCSVNTRRFQLKHEDHLQLFGPPKWRNAKHKYYRRIQMMTSVAFRELITIRLACGEIDISSRLWPNAIRATCHKGPKNGRWAVGLKPYPEYYGSCKLLPYHGMPLITRGEKGKPKLEIVPEVLLRGRMDLIRVTSDGQDEVYAYVAEDIDNELLGDVNYSSFRGMRVGEEYPRKEL